MTAAEVDVVVVAAEDAVAIVVDIAETTVVVIVVMIAENPILDEAAMDETDMMTDVVDMVKTGSKAIIETDLQQKDHQEKNQGNLVMHHLLLHLVVEEDFN